MATTENDMNTYQRDAASTALYPKGQWEAYLSLQLAGEAGEVASKFGKAIRKGEPVDYKAVAYELGDVLWYVANMSHRLGYTLQEIADMNMSKLKSRVERGVINGDGDNR